MFVKNPKRASTTTAVKLPDFKHPQKAIADGLKTITIYGINEKRKCSTKSTKHLLHFVAFEKARMSISSLTESSYCQGERPDVSQFIH